MMPFEKRVLNKLLDSYRGIDINGTVIQERKSK